MVMQRHVLGEASLELGEVTYFALSEDGTMAVVDRMGYALHVFDSMGRHEWSSAGRGDGPGEIAEGGPVTITAQHVVMVDPGKGALTAWDRDGRFLGQTPWPGRTAAIVGRGDTLHSKVAGRGLNGFDGSFQLVPFVPASNALLDPVLEVEAGVGPEGISLGCLSCALQPLPTGGFAMKPLEQSYRVVEVGRDGEVIRIWDRPDRGVVPFTPDEWVRWNHRRWRQGTLVLRSSGLSIPSAPFSPERLPPPGNKPPLESAGSIGVDGEGRLWTLPAVPDGTGAELDLFSPEGGLLGTVRLAHHLVAIEVAGNWLAGLALDDLDRPLLRVFRILPPEQGPGPLRIGGG